jgi:hypothetical protein
MQHNLDHYKPVEHFELDHFDGSLDFNGDVHVHM